MAKQTKFLTSDFETKFLKTYFAQNGQFSELKDDNPGDDTLNLADGYGNKYEEDPLQNGEYIKRLGFNGIMARLSKEIRYWQVFNNREYDPSINSLGGYPKGARCSVWYNISTGRLNSSGKNDPMCILMPIISMKDGNQTSPYGAGAINGDWFIDDGRRIGEIYISDVNLDTSPDGYLDIGGNSSQQIFNKDDYPRIKSLLDSNSGVWGYFKNYSSNPTNQFELINRKGYFSRVWSNGSSLDSGRAFNTLQADAIRNITGQYGSQGRTSSAYANASNHSAYGATPWRATGAITDLDDRNQGSSGTSTHSRGGIYFRFNASKVVPTANENRPYNFNQKMYIKV